MRAKWPYNTEQWRSTRRRILRRDGSQCRLRLPGCHGAATEVHHVVPPASGGHPFAGDNLVSSCKSCNVAERNTRRAGWARRFNGEVEPADVVTVRAW